MCSETRNVVPFVSVHNMMRLVNAVGVEVFLRELTDVIAEDFRRWEVFDKTPRVACHSVDGVIELMPASDGANYAFKYVNGHPKNLRQGLQTVMAFGMLADVASGYPQLLTEMTILTALRTAATSALASRHLAPPDATTMAIIGNGAQSEFQAIAMKAVLGLRRVRLFDVDPVASLKCAGNLARYGIDSVVCRSVPEAVEDSQVITTVTADKQNATVLSDNLVGAGLHINAVGGDCPGKTELHADILRRSDIVVEYAPQTRVEGEIQQLAPDHPVRELWRIVAGTEQGRTRRDAITVFDSVGFAIEDFSALRYVRSKLASGDFHEELDLLADPDEPRDLLGMLHRAAEAA
jgi:ornithine cyclodeaminase